MTTVEHSPAAHDDHVRHGRRLEYLTLGWNIIEGVVAIGSGIAAGSTALVGFGVDSFLESLSGGALLWRLQDGEAGAAREQQTLRLVGGSFLVLAAYVAYESASKLIGGEAPDASLPGMVMALLSLLVMPLLARAKRRVARTIQSQALHADSRQTSLCAYLSAILLAGLVLNAVFGWWWADPVAGLVMVPIIAREGWQALQGQQCCDDCHVGG